MVVAEAKPNTTRSLYSESLLGQIIIEDNEPGVFHAFRTGKYVTGTRAITNERVTVEQRVLPITNSHKKVIGTLILEQDISKQIIQEQDVQWLRTTAEQLSETLWEVAVAETNLPTLIDEGVILCNGDGLFAYVNPTAQVLFRKWGYPSPVIGTPLASLSIEVFHQLMLQAKDSGVMSQEIKVGEHTIFIKAICIKRNDQYKGVMFLLQDVTELRRKEKQLMIKSAVIKEIHHRVKNNLQTISSLLRLQMRRIDCEQSREAFRDSINRISSIALVYETLSHGDIEYVELHVLIERIVSMIVHTMSHPDKNIRFKVISEPSVLPSEKATAVTLILNELIQNAFKHAFGKQVFGMIEVQMKRQSDRLTITVRDNGCGFNPEKLTKHSLGTKIVATLIKEELGGEICYAIDRGTCITFTFPCP